MGISAVVGAVCDLASGQNVNSLPTLRCAGRASTALLRSFPIGRPQLRNGHSIANLDTLIYVLLNLRALLRIRQRLAQGGGMMPLLDA